MRQTYILSILIIGVLLSACSKLERTDFTNVEANNFFKTEKDVDAALTNYYSTGMLDWNNFDWSISIPFNTDSQADIWRFAWDDYNQDEWTFDLHNFLVTYNESRFPYSKIVQGISKGTTLIEKIKGANIDETFKKSAITQVKVLRCNLAYWGQTLFGGTELFLDPNILADVNTGKYTARRTPKEMCDFIVGQIDSIKNDLEEYDAASTSYGRATKGFALTIKLKSLMHQKRFVEAEATAREITTLGYGLVPKYKDIFTVENEKNIETIMSVICQPLIYPDNNFNAVFLAYDYVGTNPKLQNYAEAKMEWAFYDTFDTLDVRRNQIITDYINNVGEHVTRGSGSLERGAMVLKYAEDPADIGSSSGVDAIYFRYADVLLYLAEAINENSNGPTQEAIDLVNQIRARAFPGHPEKLFNLTDFAGNQQAFRDALYRERGCELYCEGWRRDDMIRMGKFDAWGKSQNPNYKPTMQLWPIPPRVVDQSKGIVVQNPGY